MMNKIKYAFYMELICNHYRVMHFLLGYSKDEIRENSKVREKWFKRAYELSRQF